MGTFLADWAGKTYIVNKAGLKNTARKDCIDLILTTYNKDCDFF